MIGSSKVCMKVTGPGLVRFVWKVDPTAQHVGTLSFWVDNNQSDVCKSQEWNSVACMLRENRDYMLAWQFQKIKSYPAGAGVGWIDDLDLSHDIAVLDKNGGQIENSSRIESIERNGSKIDSAIASSIVAGAPEDVFIYYSNITINVSNMNIALEKIQNVSMGISSIQGTLGNSSNLTNSTFSPLNSMPNSTIVGDCN
ncbi:MAG: hypothetical protein PHW87_10455, partial [Methanothrix sp.]|nr:hypothetical protein [Methanothrix sp.]